MCIRDSAYLLTQDTQYSKEAIKRILEMVSWDENENVKGDFNASTMLSLSSLAYDSFYNLLDEPQKQTLLKEIKKRGSEFYASYNNHLENHIADNHVWQMTLRIFTFAAFSVYGDLPEADIWADYCYNRWLARFPGLNKDCLLYTSALAGRVAGVQITQSEGAPGSTISIRVRGGISITQSNEPLYIIDGFPSEDGMSTIDLAEIETIDILKDASATAIYGARGANGVEMCIRDSSASML